jgi:hypothetical protein
MRELRFRGLAKSLRAGRPSGQPARRLALHGATIFGVLRVIQAQCNDGPDSLNEI